MNLTLHPIVWSSAQPIGLYILELTSPIVLEVGQLVKDPTFTLLQAVGALEVGSYRPPDVHRAHSLNR